MELRTILPLSRSTILGHYKRGHWAMMEKQRGRTSASGLSYWRSRTLGGNAEDPPRFNLNRWRAARHL